MRFIPIGKRAPAAAATPELLIPAGSADNFRKLQGFLIKPLESNTGVVYIINDSGPANTTTYANIVQALRVGTTISPTEWREDGRGFDLTNLYVAPATNGEGVYGYGKEE